jgi:hypothetical protein
VVGLIVLLIFGAIAWRAMEKGENPFVAVLRFIIFVALLPLILLFVLAMVNH